MKLSLEKFKKYLDDEYSIEDLEQYEEALADRLFTLRKAMDMGSRVKIKGFGMSEAASIVEDVLYESLRDWFKKEKWVRISSSGKIAGPCGTSKNKKNPDRCLPKAKAQSLSKGERAATARKKKKAGKKGKTVVKNTKKATVKKETANPQDGKAAPYGSGYKPIKKMKNETKEAPDGHYFTKSGNLVKGRMTKDAKERGARKSDPKDKQRSKVPPVSQTREDIRNLVVGLLHEIQNEGTIEEKDDRCTRLAKQKYDTWPSAYASGAVVRCRRGEIWKKK